MGHAEAESNLGMIFMEGLGVSRDTEAALAWLNQAIDLGNGDAMWLRKVLCTGMEMGSRQIHTLSVRVIQEVSEIEKSKGLYHLGVNFEYGLGTEQNFTLAFRSPIKRRLLKRPRSSVFLGLMVAYGRGVNQNFLKALEMFTKAAEVEHVPSQIQTVKMHANGQGVTQEIMTMLFIGLIWLLKVGNSLYVPRRLYNGGTN